MPSTSMDLDFSQLVNILGNSDDICCQSVTFGPVDIPASSTFHVVPEAGCENLKRQMFLLPPAVDDVAILEEAGEGQPLGSVLLHEKGHFRIYLDYKWWYAVSAALVNFCKVMVPLGPNMDIHVDRLVVQTPKAKGGVFRAGAGLNDVASLLVSPASYFTGGNLMCSDGSSVIKGQFGGSGEGLSQEIIHCATILPGVECDFAPLTSGFRIFFVITLKSQEKGIHKSLKSLPCSFHTILKNVATMEALDGRGLAFLLSADPKSASVPMDVVKNSGKLIRQLSFVADEIWSSQWGFVLCRMELPSEAEPVFTWYKYASWEVFVKPPESFKFDPRKVMDFKNQMLGIDHLIPSSNCGVDKRVVWILYFDIREDGKIMAFQETEFPVEEPTVCEVDSLQDILVAPPVMGLDENARTQQIANFSSFLSTINTFADVSGLMPDIMSTFICLLTVRDDMQEVLESLTRIAIRSSAADVKWFFDLLKALPQEHIPRGFVTTIKEVVRFGQTARRDDVSAEEDIAVVKAELGHKWAVGQSKGKELPAAEKVKRNLFPAPKKRKNGPVLGMGKAKAGLQKPRRGPVSVTGIAESGKKLAAFTAIGCQDQGPAADVDCYEFTEEADLAVPLSSFRLLWKNSAGGLLKKNQSSETGRSVPSKVTTDDMKRRDPHVPLKGRTFSTTDTGESQILSVLTSAAGYAVMESRLPASGISEVKPMIPAQLALKSIPSKAGSATSLLETHTRQGAIGGTVKQELVIMRKVRGGPAAVAPVVMEEVELAGEQGPLGHADSSAEVRADLVIQNDAKDGVAWQVQAPYLMPNKADDVDSCAPQPLSTAGSHSLHSCDVQVKKSTKRLADGSVKNSTRKSGTGEAGASRAAKVQPRKPGDDLVQTSRQVSAAIERVVAAGREPIQATESAEYAPSPSRHIIKRKVSGK